MKRFRFENTIYDNAEVIRDEIDDLYHKYKLTDWKDKTIEDKIDRFEKAVVTYIYDLLFALTVDNTKVEDEGALTKEIISLMRYFDFIFTQYDDKVIEEYDLDEGWVAVTYYFRDPKEPFIYYGATGIETEYEGLTQIRFFAARAKEVTTITYEPIDEEAE